MEAFMQQAFMGSMSNLSGPKQRSFEPVVYLRIVSNLLEQVKPTTLEEFSTILCYDIEEYGNI
jgi:hypothetical protein